MSGHISTSLSKRQEGWPNFTLGRLPIYAKIAVSACWSTIIHRLVTPVALLVMAVGCMVICVMVRLIMAMMGRTVVLSVTSVASMPG
jgi:hypothetical protein